MTDISYYHCQHCREDVCIEMQCPCCGLGNPPPNGQSMLDEFSMWLKIHKASRFHELHDKYDSGYIKACEVIEAELKRKLEEHRDASDRIAGDKGLLGEEISTCGDSIISEAG